MSEPMVVRISCPSCAALTSTVIFRGVAHATLMCSQCEHIWDLDVFSQPALEDIEQDDRKVGSDVNTPPSTNSSDNLVQHFFAVRDRFQQMRASVLDTIMRSHVILASSRLGRATRKGTPVELDAWKNFVPERRLSLAH